MNTPVPGHMLNGGGGSSHQGRHCRNRVARGYMEALFQQRARCPAITTGHKTTGRGRTLGHLLDAHVAVVRATLE
jgi:hypothetical protein